MIYDILTSDAANLGTPTTLAAVLTQIGAASAGAATASYRFRIPSNAKRYVGFKATGSASGDSSAASATLEVLI